MPASFTTRLLVFALCILVLISCASPIPTSSPSLATETSLPSPTAASEAASTQTETPTPFPTLTPDLARPQYILDLQMNYTAKAATVQQTITYPNWTGEALTDLVLAVEPNLWSGGFNLKSIEVDGQPVSNYTLGTLSQRLE